MSDNNWATGTVIAGGMGWDNTLASRHGPPSRDLRLLLLCARHFMSEAEYRVIVRPGVYERLAEAIAGTTEEVIALIDEAVTAGWLTWADPYQGSPVLKASMPGKGVVR